MQDLRITPSDAVFKTPFSEQFIFNIKQLNYRLGRLAAINATDMSSQNEYLMVFDAALILFRALFKTKRWKERCHMPEHSGCKDVTDGFVKDYGELKAMVDALINDYKEYLSGEQMIYLEAIRGNRLNQFFRTYEKSNGNCDYTDEFYELVLQPEYRMLILLYYSLCKVSGIKVKEE